MSTEIRILTWKQPYATLMLPRFNKIETRTWDTKYRGLVAIHAAKVPYTEKQIDEISGKMSIEIEDDIILEKCPLGVIIAVGTLVDCRPMRPEDARRCYVDYNPNLFCHIYENVRELDVYIPYKGKQGWSKLPEEIINVLEFA